MLSNKNIKTPLVKHLDNIKQIIAGDKCFLKEIFHPDRDELNTNYSLAFAYIEHNGKTINHCLKQTETYFIISGQGIMHINNNPFEISAGSSYIVPENCSQWLENTGEGKLEFLVIVDPPWRKEDETILGS